LVRPALFTFFAVIIVKNVEFGVQVKLPIGFVLNPVSRTGVQGQEASGGSRSRRSSSTGALTPTMDRLEFWSIGEDEYTS
jgi:hypothetical protein